MYQNRIYDTVSQALPELLRDLLKNGRTIPSRNGETKEFTHIGITIKEPTHRELLVLGRRNNIAAQIVETMWVLSGSDRISTILPYLPRAADFSDDRTTWSGAYGARLLDWEGLTEYRFDQIELIVDLLREDPYTRRAVATIYDPEKDLARDTKDVPCNDWLSFLARPLPGKSMPVLDLHVGVRSNDVIWGWSGINAFEWSALLEIVARLAGMMPGALHFSTTSFHLYDKHYDRAAEIVEANPSGDDPHVGLAPSPAFQVVNEFDTWVDFKIYATKRWFEIEQGIRNGDDMGEAIDTFPEPMLRSWLGVILWYWTGDDSRVPDGALKAALSYSTHPKWPEPTPPEPDLFLTHLKTLHAEKDAAYGDSWMKRGEQVSILANVARKADRLASGGETVDETQVDTAVDLLMYLVKYRAWLFDTVGAGTPPTENFSLTHIDSLLDRYRALLRKNPAQHSDEDDAAMLIQQVEHLIEDASISPTGYDGRLQRVEQVLVPVAWRLAEGRWQSVQPLTFDTDGLSRIRYSEKAPHSRACGLVNHRHGSACSPDCPTCQGREIGDDYRGADHD